MTSSWRSSAAPIIARVLAETAGKPPEEVRAALRAAYPFGVRRHHPYRIWCDEVRVQTGRQKISGVVRRLQARPPLPPDERQQELFGEDQRCI
jgi:hypothetical protein